ncbi:MAG: bifunctional diaminohydroxyphosphoribosylaminopyrimidine deaminase/5-amino-6-(5-phosphoribosylamino)uracil reductase RibD [Gammaproteobacteria bacterium]|nr:bifunctional diaminohydroxyphosphoribosylaminopyrimidine deaminase/5-amino-6-(5-phosphoribosylamino)uracil reductase RibD [Gammaproteobacteria bacterium]
MARALRLAMRGLNTTRPNPRVGCVIVKDGAIVGEGFHARAGGPHAEVVALAAAGAAANGATVYVTLEPCCHYGRTPPCAHALVAANVARVVYAVQDPNPRVAGGGAAHLAAAGIAIAGGLLSTEATASNRGFFMRQHHQRPWVQVKLAMSLDGKIALADGRSQWITGSAARADVQRLRAAAGAILTGSGTVLVDDPRLNVRDPRFEVGATPPPRLILDTELRTPPEARLFTVPGEIRLFTAHVPGSRWDTLVARGAIIEELPRGHTHGLDLAALMARLHTLEVNELLVEAGPTLVGALLDLGCVDELVLYVAPVLLGAAARAAFTLVEPLSLDLATRFRVVQATTVGIDQRLILQPLAA